ncbi:MAG: alpha-amylase [Armatimonadetes bacterium]|nr:alpha-amylase [Anaerolineae bacterium]
MDFIFGTLATDELKVVHHRALRRGVQHQHAIQPIDPLPGDPVTLTVIVGQATSADQVTVYYTTDGSIPDGERGTPHNGQTVALTRVEYAWDTVAWAYLGVWRGTLPAQSEGTVMRYRIGAWESAGTDEVFADYPEHKYTSERAAAAFFAGLPVPADVPSHTARRDVFTYYVDTYTTPDWARDAVLYQIMPDRFYPGDGRDWLTPDSLTGIYGGTLWGVRDKLDYIAALGVTCIWLTPTFPSPTHHGYDVTDYLHVEPRLGGDDAMHALVQAAHARGIRVLLDLVCNHISHEHPHFVDARQSVSSPYREWFLFDDHDPIGYKTFFGVETMPYINLLNPGARAWMLSIAQHWLREYDIDGYRLDHANGPGPDFWADFRAACRAVKPDCWVIGEVVEAPDILRSYVGRLDGLLDFHMEDALRRTYAFNTMTEREFAQFTERHYSYFPASFSLPTFLDNHDMDRFLFAAGGNQAALRRAAAAQMRLPPPPVIYYGTEVGLSQNSGKHAGLGLEVSRLPMLWGSAQDADLLAYYRQLIQQRATMPR